MKLLHRLWLKINDIDEYDVKYGAWKIYQIMHTNNLIKGGNLFTDNDIVKKGGRPYIKCQFIHNGKSTEEMRFSGETDFNFSTQKKRELCRSRYENYKKILERDLAGEGILEIYLEMLNECSQMYHSQDNISIMLQSGNMQGAKGAIGLDRLDVWLLILDMKYRYNINMLQNHCTMENCSEIEKYLNLFDDVYDYASTIYHINSELVDKLIESGKRPLDSATNIITYMSLAKEFWNQKHAFIENQLKYKQ